ncbi:MAG: hypothetical protein ACK42C_02025 [Aquificaceae bacterium]|jgi:hypothetical protein|uniref:hypothetical protein n=1 Tax=Hydrogenobacter sp. Uz 6-8 TaxID=3384828 RepID=UPI000F18694D|nr:MAG: hypothetical protein D6804_05040 [Aquificota bacterium]
MADLTKAGLDRGDLQKELEHTLLSAKMLYRTYSVSIDDLTEEEMKADFEEYSDQLSRVVIPLVKRAEASRDSKLVSMAYELRYTYEKLLELIQQRLNTS